jgi:hypothetical protein
MSDRVRFSGSGFEGAWERALSVELPTIPTHSGDIQLAMLAALCRELQREAGENAFICPVNVVQRLLNLREDSHANNLLHALERAGVIKRAEHGWRYLYPM